MTLKAHKATSQKDIIEPTNADEEEDMGKATKDRKRKTTNEKKDLQGIIQREVVTLAFSDFHHMTRIGQVQCQGNQASKSTTQLQIKLPINLRAYAINSTNLI